MQIADIREKSDKFIVPIGPQHPALKEPGHFEFMVDGETVTGATVRLGYVHRGIEKATESRNWVQNLYLLERICGICSHSHAMAYSLGVESGQIELLYQFCEGAAVLTLRITLPRENPTVPSIQAIVPSVSFYERELMEMYGITIPGAANTDRLFLPDEWPQNVYPLRKDFVGLEKTETPK